MAQTLPKPFLLLTCSLSIAMQAELAKVRVESGAEQARLAARVKELEAEVSRAVAAGQTDAQSQAAQVGRHVCVCMSMSLTK